MFNHYCYMQMPYMSPNEYKFINIIYPILSRNDS